MKATPRARRFAFAAGLAWAVLLAVNVAMAANGDANSPADALRAIDVAAGGLVVGVGVVVLSGRARAARAAGSLPGLRASLLLLLVNGLVVTYIALTLRWDEPLGWRSVFAVVVFALKGRLLFDIRLTATAEPPRAQARAS
jgi:peptidoglycan/LPS O-acetylase OafA/YrhL